MSQANYPIFDGDERSSLLKKVQTKDDFRAKKWRCVTLSCRIQGATQLCSAQKPQIKQSKSSMRAMEREREICINMGHYGAWFPHGFLVGNRFGLDNHPNILA
jgi:hypothetical protein